MLKDWKTITDVHLPLPIIIMEENNEKDPIIEKNMREQNAKLDE